MSPPLIQRYTMNLATPECSPGSEWYRAFIALENDIAGVLPYLNAALKGRLDYNHKAGILLWESEDRKRYAFRPHEIAIAPIFSREEAQTLTDSIVGTINDVWDRRGEIKPNLEGKKALPNVLDILRLLPRTNCKECGSPTCMAFAAVLRSDSAQLSRCPYLSEDAYLKLVS
ncbi:MAG: hypothetical protein FJZ95_10895 [Chloroflexi bacterium]|nr:hypothetical protein [Chloroflexota bacterium]